VKETEFMKDKEKVLVLPNLDWYLGISLSQQLSPRCPYASVYRCPRFFQSLSLLGDAGSTKIDSMEDNNLKESWEKTDIWPTTAEQATSVSGPVDDIKHFSRFCPEVSFERFGLFAAELHKYTDEFDVGNAHKVLCRERVLPDDWRWDWWHIVPMHYSECPLYSLVKLGKGRMKAKKNQFWDKVAKHPVYITIGLVGSIASVIGLWYAFSPGNTMRQGSKLESSPGAAVYQAGRDILIQQQQPGAIESFRHQQAETTKEKKSQPLNKPIQNEPSVQQVDSGSTAGNKPSHANASEGDLYNEEHIRNQIAKALMSGNVSEAIAFLSKFRTEETTKEEAKHVFDYCIKNKKLKEASKVIGFLSQADKEEAKQLIEVEKMKGDSK
jgi:hypothetical protein